MLDMLGSETGFSLVNRVLVSSNQEPNGGVDMLGSETLSGGLKCSTFAGFLHCVGFS